MSSSLDTVGEALARHADALSEAVVARHYAQVPSLAARYGAAGRAKCVQDAAYHLSYLREALDADSPDLFADYVAWAQVMLAGRNIPTDDLRVNLECLRAVVAEHLVTEGGGLAAHYVDAGLRRLQGAPRADETDAEAPHRDLARAYLQALLQSDRAQARALVMEALEEGTSVKDLYLHVFQWTQYEIGRRWQRNEVSVAQEHFCTAATQQIMAELYPRIFTPGAKANTFVMACVSEELHEIGARMVADFFEMEGWSSYYYGANTPTQAVVEAVASHRPQVLGVSATMTFHVAKVKALVEAVRAHPAGRDVGVLVGGYPFRVAPRLWQHVGADDMAHSADDAIAKAQRWTASRT